VAAIAKPALPGEFVNSVGERLVKELEKQAKK